MERPRRVVGDSSLLNQLFRSGELSLNETRRETRFNPDSSWRGRNRTKFSRHKYRKLSAEQKESYHKHLLCECFPGFPKVKYGLRMENENTDLGYQTLSNEIRRENIEGNMSAVRKSLSNRCFGDEIPTKEFAENSHGTTPRQLPSTCHKALTSQSANLGSTTINTQISLSEQCTAQSPTSLLEDRQAASLQERVDAIEIHLAKLEELGYFRSREVNDCSTSPIRNHTSSSIGGKELSSVSIMDTGHNVIRNRQQNHDIEHIQMKVTHPIDKYLSEVMTKAALPLSNNESIKGSPKSESTSTPKKNNFQVSDDAQYEDNDYLSETRKEVQRSSEVNEQLRCTDFSPENFLRTKQFSLESHSEADSASFPCDSRRQFPFTERNEYYQQPERSNWVLANNQPIITSQIRICSTEAYHLWWCRLTEAENETLPMIYTFMREEWICNIPSDATERFIIVAETVNRHSHKNIRLLEYSTRFSKAHNVYKISANSCHLVVLLKYNLSNDWHVTVVLRSLPCANSIFNELLRMNGTPDSQERAPAYFQLIKLRSKNGTSEDQVDILAERRAECDPIVQTFDLEIVKEETILMQKSYEKLKDNFKHTQPGREKRNAQNVLPENLYDMKLKTKSNRKLIFFEELEENELNDLAWRKKSLENSSEGNDTFLKQNCELFSAEFLERKSYSKKKNSEYMFRDKFPNTDLPDHLIYEQAEIASKHILQNQPAKTECLSETKCLLNELQTEKELTIKNDNFSDDPVDLPQLRNTSKSQENGHQEFWQDNEGISRNLPASHEVKESPEISIESRREICRPTLQNTLLQCKAVTSGNMNSDEKSLTVSAENILDQSVEIFTEKTSPSILKLNELQNEVHISSECDPSTHEETKKIIKNKNNSVTYFENSLEKNCNNTATCYSVDTENYGQSIAVKTEGQSQTIKAELNYNYEDSSLIRTLSAETVTQKEIGIEMENGTATIQNTPFETTKYINEGNNTKDHMSVLQLKEELYTTNEHKCDLTHSSKKRNISVEETITLPVITKLSSNSSETIKKTVTEISLSNIIDRSTILEENAKVFCQNNCSEGGVTSSIGTQVNIGESEFPKCLHIPNEIISARKEKTQMIQIIPVKESEQSNFKHCKNNAQHQDSSVRNGSSKSTCKSFPLKSSKNGNKDSSFELLYTVLAPENKELSESCNNSNELSTPTQIEETKMTLSSNNQDTIPDTLSTKSFNKISNSDSTENSSIYYGIAKPVVYLHSVPTLEENLKLNKTASRKLDSESSTSYSKVTTEETRSVKNISFDYNRENIHVGKSEQDAGSNNMKDISASLYRRNRNSKSHDCNFKMANTKQTEHTTFPVSIVEATGINKKITSSTQREDLPVGTEQRYTLKLHTDLIRRGLEKSNHSLSSVQIDTSDSINKLTETSLHDCKGGDITFKCKELDLDRCTLTDYPEQTVQNFKESLKISGNAETSQTYCKQILATVNDMTEETASKPAKVAERTNEKIVKTQSTAKLVETQLLKNHSCQADNQTVFKIKNTQNFNTTELCQKTPNDLKQKLEGASASNLITEMNIPIGEPMNSLNIPTPNINKRPGQHAVNINQPKEVMQRAESIQPDVRIFFKCAGETRHEDSTQHIESKSSVEQIGITSKPAGNHIYQTSHISEMKHTMNTSDNIKREMANVEVKPPFSFDTNFLEKSLGNSEEKIPSHSEMISIVIVEKEVPSKSTYTDQKSSVSSEKESSFLTSDKQLLLFTKEKSFCKKDVTESSKDYGNQVITSVHSETLSLDRLVIASAPLPKEQFSSDYGTRDSSKIQQTEKYPVTKEHGEFNSNKDKELETTVNEIQKSSILPHKSLGTINQTSGLQCNTEIIDHTVLSNTIENIPLEIEKFDNTLETQRAVNTSDDFQMSTNTSWSEEYNNQSKVSVNLMQGSSKLQKESSPVKSSLPSINNLPIIFKNTESYEKQTNVEKEVSSIHNNNKINNSKIALKEGQVNLIQGSYSDCSEKINSEFTERRTISPTEKSDKLKMVNSQGVGLQRRSLRITEYEEQSSSTQREFLKTKPILSTVTALSQLPSMKINEDIRNSDSVEIDMQEMGATSMDLLDCLQLKEERTFCTPQPLSTSLVPKSSSISVDQKYNLYSQHKNEAAIEGKTLGSDTKHPGNKKLPTVAEGTQSRLKTLSPSTSVYDNYNVNLQPKNVAPNEDKKLGSDINNPENKLPTTIVHGAESRLKTPSPSSSDNNREITIRNQTSTKAGFEKNFPLVSNTVISPQQRISDSVEYESHSKNLKDNKFHSLSESGNSPTSPRIQISDNIGVRSTQYSSQLQSTSKPESESVIMGSTIDDCKRDTHTVPLKETSKKDSDDGKQSLTNIKAVNNNSPDTRLPMRIPLDLKQLSIASQGAKTAAATESSPKFEKQSKKISSREENQASNLIDGKSRISELLQTGKCSDVNPAPPVKENSQIGDNNYNILTNTKQESLLPSKAPPTQSKLVNNTFKNTKQCTTFLQSNRVSSSDVKVSSKDFSNKQVVSPEQNTSKCKMESKVPKKL